MSIFTDALSGTRARYLLLGSLTLNLVFAGAAGAVALQHATKLPPLQPIVGMNHGVEHRFDHIAASLPANDANILLAEFHAQAVKLATAETQVRLTEQAVRDSLRAQPFDPAAVRAAMAQTTLAQAIVSTSWCTRPLPAPRRKCRRPAARRSPIGADAGSPRW